MTSSSHSLAQEKALKIIQAGNENSLDELHKLQEEHPSDYIIHFLYAAELAQQQKYNSAMIAFQQVVSLKPDYFIARFQLCLLAFSLEDNVNLNKFLPGLLALESSHYLNQFSSAINELAKNNIQQALKHLDHGIQINNENLPLNEDMKIFKQTIISQTNNNDDLNSSPQPKVDHSVTNSLLLDVYKQKTMK